MWKISRNVPAKNWQKQDLNISRVGRRIWTREMDMVMVLSWVGERGMKEDSDRGNPRWMIFLRMTGLKLLR